MEARAWRQALAEQSPQLPVGDLTLERVSLHKRTGQMVVRFLSGHLMDRGESAHLKRAMRKLLSGAQVEVQVACPALLEDVKRQPHKYADWFYTAITERMPSAAPYLRQAQWSAEGDDLFLTIPSKLGEDFLRLRGVEQLVSTLVKENFLGQVQVSLRSKEGEEKLNEFLEERRKRDEALVKAAVSDKAAKGGGAKSEGPKVILGRSIISSNVLPIGELNEQSGRVCIQGFVLDAPEKKELRGGVKLLCAFGVTDYTGSILCKAFLEKDLAGKADQIKAGAQVKVRGNCAYDNFTKEISLLIDDLQQLPLEKREDLEEEKRVELHLHTQMSSMDGVSSAASLISRAAEWGHEAVAITDHGVVQAYPEAFDTIKKLKKSGKNIKLIPGMEGYLIDDSGVVVEQPDDGPLEREYVVLDIETTGLLAGKDRIIEIAAVKLQGERITGEFHTLVNPGMRIPPASIKVHGITDDQVADAPAIGQVMGDLAAFCQGHVLCAHNASFDVSFLRIAAREAGVELPPTVLDTLPLARAVRTDLRRHKLDTVCKKLGVKLDNHHRALFDTRATAQMMAILLEKAKAQHGVKTLRDLNVKLGRQVAASGASYHIIVLAASQKGLENLYRLVSLGHLEHFDRRPHVLKSELARYREGLILGSACEAGELIRGMLSGKSQRELEEIASFYDFLEIQPIGNNAFLLRNGQIADEEGLRGLNKRVLALGDQLGKPVCATCDVHFLDPQDAIFREVLMHGMGFEDASLQAPLYLRTTREMLDEFAYLGPRAREVVIDNPRRIAARIEDVKMFPKHPRDEETFQPSLPHAKEEIEGMANRRAREIYGDPLPDVIKARLKKELDSIIGNGFETLYYSAHLLVKKSNEDGYLVGSRGSVGSSFVATMCGITEVNPLPPHYVCGNCCFSDFEIDKQQYPCGVDLPPRACPVCGQPLQKTGYDIPFEVFLGFNGDKVPDIDLNFSGVYQPKAHKYVETLFGKGQVFKAGTIGTLAEKTAYGYVKKYCEEVGRRATQVEMNRLVKGCTGVKRTTGQHPGGMVIVPHEYSVYQFSPTQHPADDKNSDIITTHFDFGSLHDILVKLDILGHDDPTMINMLERLTGVNARELPLNDPQVMGLFTSPQPLGVTPEEIRGCKTGTLGIPEFGTKFVRQMLEDTRPTTMEELIRISGLSHGTNVWLNNAQDMIREGVAVLKECFCTRDDIMNYLIAKGVAPKMAFTTMEAVRKGRKLTPEMEAAMREAEVPQHYIDSCNKIEYMFPRGHAAAYVMMGLRVAWFKVYRPIEYYTCFFTVRADEFDASIMLDEPEELCARMDAIEKLDKKESTARDERLLTLLELVQEMRARGLGFLPVDLYASSHNEFLIQDGKIRPPFNRLPGVGDTAAEALAEARKQGPFISVEDLQRRARVSGAVIDTLRSCGALRGLPESSQVTLFA